MTSRRHAATLSLLLAATAACATPAIEKVETEAPVPVTVEAARVETLTSTITVTGSVVTAPGAEWTIIAPGAARIAELPKAENDAVREGDVLVRFDMPNVSADLLAKRAEATQATTRVATAAAKVARVSGLVAQGVAAPRELEEAKQDEADAQAAKAQAESGVAAAESLADRAVVRARFDGVVAKRWHNPGDFVDASAADPVLRLIDPRHVQVVASVPMSMLGRVVVGRRATIAGSGGAAETATVLNKPAQVDPASATADVRLAFSTPTTLPIGAVVQVEIIAETRPQAIVVPTAAIVYEENEIFVMVAGADNKAHKYPVVLGLAAHGLTEITNGIAAGAAVIVRGQDGLPDGGAILVQK